MKRDQNNDYREYSEADVEVMENMKNRLLIPAAFFSIVFCLTCFIGMAVLQEKILIPADVLFYEATHGMTYLLILALILAFFLVGTWLLNKYNIRSMGDDDVLIDWIKDKKVVRTAATVKQLIWIRFISIVFKESSITNDIVDMVYLNYIFAIDYKH